jgi:hypothetical protein
MGLLKRMVMAFLLEVIMDELEIRKWILKEDYSVTLQAHPRFL